MNKNFSVLVLLLFVVGVSFVNSQTPAKLNPYIDGEVLSYDGKFNKLILRGANVADLTFTTSKAADGKNYTVKAEAVSKGTLLKLFGVKFLQNITTTVDGENFYALKTVKNDIQNERVRDSEAIFDYTEKKVTYVETDPKDPNRPPRRIASAIDGETYDLVSAVYRLRSIPLAVGKSFMMNVSDSGLVYQIPVKVTKRERQDTIFGKVQCFRLEPQVFGKDKIVESEGEMVIWVTDDYRQLPVRSTIKTTVAKFSVKLDIKLRKYEVKK